MIQLIDLSIFNAADGRRLVDGLSFTLNRGDCTVLIGEEGNGKSTLLKYIYDPRLVEGRVYAEGSVNRGGHRMGYLAQEATARENALSVREFLGLEEHELWRAEALCAELEADPALVRQTRPLGTLSGGERVKARLVKVLLGEPDMLLLDEPTNDVDIETLEVLEKLILSFDGGVLYVSHDETLIENTARAVVHLEHIHHKKVARSTYAALPYRRYAEERERAFAHQAQVSAFEHAEQKKKEERWQKIYEKVDAAQRGLTRQDPSTGRLLKKKMHSVLSQGRRLERERENLTEAPMAEFQILLALPEVSLPPKKELLRLRGERLLLPDGQAIGGEFDLDVNAAEHIVITGRNGSGKSTLLRMLYLRLCKRQDVKVFYMPQDYFEVLDENDTPISFLAPTGEKDAVTRARTYLGSVRFTKDEAQSPVTKLSGGQKAKLFFVKMALDGPDVLLLDEPTRNFSPLSAPVIREIISSFGGCVIAVSHDRRFISEVGRRIVRMEDLTGANAHRP